MPRTDHGFVGIYNSSPITLASGDGSALATDANGVLKVTVIGGAGATSDGTYNATPPTIVDGATASIQLDQRGNQLVSLATGATVVGVITSGADAVSNTMNRLAVSSWNKIFNGTTWDRQRSAVITPSATLTGIANSLPWGMYNATPTTRTEGQGGPLQEDAAGNMLVSLGTQIEGENSTLHIMKAIPQCTYTNMTSATTTTAKSGAGILHGIVVSKAIAAATITVYDNTSGSGTKIATITFGAALLTDPPLLAIFDTSFATGLTVVTSGATDLTIATV